MGRWIERARTDFEVKTFSSGGEAQYRAIEVSSTGILIDRGRPVAPRDSALFLRMEISLPERHRRVHALARPVWAFGTQQAFKFVKMTDADRLSIAEHVDLQHRRAGMLQ